MSENPVNPNKSDSLLFETLKCYISNIALLQDNAIVFSENNSFHLLDAANNKSLHMSLPCKKTFNRIRFTIGIDSITNVSGAMSGDLDPIYGMYWTWQSGYINTKIEGKSIRCKNPQKAFQFHLGGYAYPHNNAVVVTLPTNEKVDQTIIIQMAEWYKLSEWQLIDHIMSPSKAAQKMALVFSNCFHIADN